MNKYPKVHLLPPKSGPQPQGLNLKYNNVKRTSLQHKYHTNTYENQHKNSSISEDPGAEPTAEPTGDREKLHRT